MVWNMTSNKGQKLKRSHSLMEIQSFEDKVASIQQRLSAVRRGMQDQGIESLELKSGTFLHVFERVEAIVINWESEYTKALVRKNARETAAKIKSQSHKSDKKA